MTTEREGRMVDGLPTSLFSLLRVFSENCGILFQRVYVYDIGYYKDTPKYRGR